MEALTRDAILLVLRKANPLMRADYLVFYADCFLEYCQAVANIAANGTIVLHPRTGAPMENPYLKVKAQAMAGLMKIRLVKGTEPLWLLVETP